MPSGVARRAVTVKRSSDHCGQQTGFDAFRVQSSGAFFFLREIERGGRGKEREFGAGAGG